MLTPYHQQAFDMVEWVPHLHHAIDPVLTKCADAYGHPFPPAVREWYAITEASALLAHYSNTDSVVDLDDIFALAYHPTFFLGWHFPHPRYLPILLDNAYGRVWCAELGTAADPPIVTFVVHDLWEGYPPPIGQNHHPATYARCAPSLSRFIRDQIRVFFNQHGECISGSHVAADGLPFPSVVARLQQLPWIAVREYPSGVAHFTTTSTHVLCTRESDGIDVTYISHDKGELRGIVTALARQVPINIPVWLQ